MKRILQTITILVFLTFLTKKTEAQFNIPAGTYYFDNSQTNWSNVYLFVGHGTYIISYQLTSSGNAPDVFSYNLASQWNGATGFYFANNSGGVTSGSSSYNINTAIGSLGSPQPTAKSVTFTSAPTAGQTFVPYATASGFNCGILSSNPNITAPSNVVSGTNVMYYINQSYGGTLGITNNSSTTCISTVQNTQFATNNNFVEMLATNVPSTLSVSNNCGGWVGSGAFTSQTSTNASGARYITGASTSKTNATSVTTSASSTSITQGTSSITMTATHSGGVTSSYGRSMYVQYYINGTYYTSSAKLSGTSTTATLNTSALTAGTYTIQSVITDRLVYYKAADITLTVTVTAPTISSLSANSGYTGTTITITGTSFTGATAVSFGGTAAASYNVVNATTITAVVAAGTSGNVSVTTPNGTANLAGFTYLGYITTQTGNWSSTATWLGGIVPNATSHIVTIAHNVTLDQAATVSSITINSGVTLTGSDGSARTLTLASGGTFTNNSSTSGGYSAISTGSVTFSGAGTITGTQQTTFSNLTLNGVTTISRAPIIAGQLTLNSGYNFTGTPGTLSYSGTSSILNYNSGGTPTISAAEWPTSSGPNSVLITGSTTVNLNADRSLAGNLTVTDGRLQVSGGNARTLTMNGATQTITISNASGGSILGTDNGLGNDLTLLISSGSTTTLTGDATTSNDDDKKFFNITVNGTLALSRGILCKNGTFSVAGTLQINANGYVQSTNGVAASYSAGTLIYNNGGIYTSTDFEWPTSSGPTNVTLQTASTSVNINNSKTISGTLTLGANNTVSLNGNNLSTVAVSTAGATSIVQNNHASTGATFTINNGSSASFSGVLQNGGTAALSFIKTGAGTLTLAGANSYTGATTINAGTLTLGANNALPISSSAGLIQFAAGTPTFNLDMFNLGTSTAPANSAGALDFDVNTTVNLGSSGTNTYYFKASNGQTWDATTITINNWTGTAGSSGTGPRIFIGSDATGLTGTQLGKITFTGFGVATILSTGEVVPLATAVPTLSTIAISGITTTSASSGGNTISDAGTSITEKGVVWDISINPTIALSTKTNDGTGTANFSSSITLLSPQTLYNVRAFATNSTGTGYGSNLSFRTLSNPPTAQAAGLTATAASATQINLSLSTAATFPASGATNSGYFLIYNAGGAPSYTVTNGAAPVITTGTRVTITDGTAPTAPTFPSNVTGLTAATSYTFHLIPYTWDGTNASTYNYLTTSFATATATTLATLPSAQPTSLVFSGVSSSSITATWTAATGSPAGYIVLYGTADPDTHPVAGTTYTAGNTLGNATVAYVGSGLTTGAINSLAAATTYQFRVYSYNGSGATINYLTTSPLSGSQSTLNDIATADFRSAGAGPANWNTAASWEYNSTGSTWITATAVPTANNNVTVRTGHTITMDVSPTFNATKTLTVNGTLTAGTNTISGAGNFTISSGTLNTANTEGISGTVTTSGTNTFTSGTINFNAGGAQNFGTITALSGIDITTSGASTNVTLNSNPTIRSITIGTSSTLTGADGSTRTLTIAASGSFTNNGTFSATANNTVSFAGAGTVSGSSTTTFSTVILNGALTGSFSVATSGTLTMNSTASVSGTVTTVGAATFNGTAGASTFNNLTLNGAATLTKVTQVNGTLQFNAGASVSQTQTYGGSAVLLYNGTSFNTTDNEWPTISGPRNVTITAGASNVVTLNSNKTIAGTLTLNTGSIDLNATTLTLNSGSAAQTITGSGSNSFTINSTGNGIISLTGTGSHTITVSNFGTSSSGGLIIGANVTLQMNSNATLNCGGNGTSTSMVTIAGTLQINGSNIAPSTAPFYTSSSTLEYRIGYGAYQEWLSGTALTTPGVPQNVVINAPTLSTVSISGNRSVLGNFTITNGKFSLNGSNTLSVGGNWLRQNSSTSEFIPSNGTVVFNGTSAQSIQVTGSGTNTATFWGLTINKTSGGVSLSSPVNVTNTITLTLGVLNTDATNLLTITNTATSGIAGGNSNSFIDGPVTWNLPASPGTATYIFATGDNSGYYPIRVINPTSSGGTFTLTAQAFAADNGGTPNYTDVFFISPTEYWSLSSTGNFSGSTIRIDRPNTVSPLNRIARSTTVNGTYANVTASVSASQGTTSVSTSGAAQFFCFAQDAPAGPYTAQAGDWNNTDTWNGGTLPGAGTTVTILHNVTVNSAVSNAIGTINIASGRSLSIGAGTITTTNLTNGGTLEWTGSGTLTIANTGNLTNNVTFTRGSGTVAFAGSGTVSGTISFNNVTIAGGVNFGTASTIASDGSLQINSGGFVSTNAPTYNAASTLIYNTTGTYGRGSEWSATSGAGYPGNVTITNNTTLNLGNGGTGVERRIAGNLTINTGSTFSMNESGSEMTAAATILGNVTNSGTIVLSGSNGGDLNVGGNFTTTGTFTHNNRALFFVGTSGTQVVNAGTFILPFVGIGGSATVQLGASTNMEITGTSGLTFTNTNATSGLDLNGRTLLLKDGGGNLSLGEGSGVRRITSSSGLGVVDIANAGITITRSGSATIVFGDNVTVQTNTSIDFGSGISTIGGGTSGILRLNSGGSVSTNPPTYAAGSTLNYNSVGTYARSAEWNATTGAGYPHNVLLSGNTTLNVVNGSTDYQRAAGNLTVESGSTFSVVNKTSGAESAQIEFLGNITNAGTITLSGTTNRRLKCFNFTNNGTINLGSVAGGDLEVTGNFVDNATFNSNQRAVFFTGTGIQTISGSATPPLNIDYVLVNKASGRVQLQQDLLVGGPLGGNAMVFSAPTDIFDLNGYALTIGTATVNSVISGTPSFRGGGNSAITILGTGAIGNLGMDQTTPGTTNVLNNLILNRTERTSPSVEAGSMSLGNDLIINGTLTLTAGTFTVKGSPTLSLNGNNVAGTASNLDVDNTSRLSFGGSTSGITIPTHITALHTLNIANTSTNGVATYITGNTISIANTLSVAANATLNPAAADIISGGGTLSGTGTVRVTRTAATADFSTQYPISGKTLTDLTVNYFNSTGSQTISALTYGKLTQSNTSGMNTLGGNVVTNELTLASGGTLSIGAGNALTINGTVAGTGLIRGSSTSNLTINGTGTVGTLNFDQTSNAGKNISGLTNIVRNFTINGSGAEVNLGTPLNMANGVFTMASGTTLNLGNNDITLKSDNTAATMAQVGTLAGTINYSGTGRFVAERAMTNARRGFRNLSSGGIISDADIWTNWQEAATTAAPNPAPGYGMHITGGNTRSTTTLVHETTGFDGTRTGAASLWTYGPTNNYVEITSTKNNILYPFVGYFAIVRGDRSYDIFTGGPDLNAATSTTLRTKGQLLRGTVTINTSGTTYTNPVNGQSTTLTSFKLNTQTGANRFSLIGNPFASTIAWSALTKTNLNNNYWVWDQAGNGGLGNWVIHNGSTAENTGFTGGATNGHIQPGQSFFVQHIAGDGPPELIIEEADKVADNTKLVSVFDEQPVAKHEKMRFILRKQVNGNWVTNDDALVAFRADFSNQFDANDANKFANNTENIGFLSNNARLGLECRQLPTITDTLALRIWNVTAANPYIMSVASSEFANKQLDAFVWDKLTNSYTKLGYADTTHVAFTPTTDTNTFINRFFVVFRTPVPLSNGVGNLQGRQVGNNNVVSWQAQNEQTAGIQQYVVEKSNNGQQYNAIGSLIAKGGNAVNDYQFVDENAAVTNAYYRVKIVSGIETGKFTNTVQLKAANSKKQVSIYPTVITNQQFQLQLTGYEKGAYTVRIFNSIGQDIWSQKLQHEGGNSNYTIRMAETTLSSGTYFVHLYQNNGAVITQKIQIP